MRWHKRPIWFFGSPGTGAALCRDGGGAARAGLQAAIQGSYVQNTLARALGRFAEAFGRLREATHIAAAADEVFAVLDAYPPGQKRFFMKKARL